MRRGNLGRETLKEKRTKEITERLSKKEFSEMSKKELAQVIALGIAKVDKIKAGRPNGLIGIGDIVAYTNVPNAGRTYRSGSVGEVVNFYMGFAMVKEVWRYGYDGFGKKMKGAEDRMRPHNILKLIA